LAGVRTRQAIANPNAQDASEQRKIVSNEQDSCMNNPTIGPTDIAMLLARP
jgi:hypothetical protein